MSLKDCLNRRGEAEVQVDSEIRRLRKSCQQEVPSTRAIQTRIQALENARREWVTSHVSYVQKANWDLRSPDQLHYFNTKDELIDEAIDAAIVLIGGSANDEEPEVDVDKLRENCNLLQFQLESELLALKVAVAGEVEGEACADYLIQANELAIMGGKQFIKMKPLDPPSFDGQAKNYARFKERFQELIASTYGAQAQLEFLEGALPERIKDRMSMVKKTPEQLWEQLDEMFGDPRVMVNEAMADLHSLDYKKLGNSFISKFSATLNDTEKLLEANGNADHLSHPREVVQLQDMLPRNEKLEYVRRKKNYIGSDYQKLKAFLSERRLEEEELRKIGSGSKSEDSSSKVCD